MGIDRKVKEFTKHLSSENLPVYYYRYRHKGSITLPKIRFNMTIDFGVSHGDDNFILYRQADPVEALKSKEDALMTEKMISMWTNFAAHGSPTETGEWSPVGLSDADEPKYAILSNKGIVMAREEDFSQRSMRIIELEDLSETFRQMNVSDHPAVKSMIADKQKEFEEEHKHLYEQENEDEESHQPRAHVGNIPDDMVKEKLVDEFENTNREGNLQDSVMGYISKNILTNEKEGEDNWDDEKHEWAEGI